MIIIFLYFVIVLITFFGFAFWNYKQTDKSKTVPAGAAWTMSLFWPIMLPLALVSLVLRIGDKIEETFDNISKKGFKKDENK